jgi:two-component system, NarL family, response regulator LiaR
VRPVRSKLTSREWEILDLLCAGATTARISAELSVSVETVRSHIRNMLKKLGVRSRAEAVALADGLREPGSEPPMLARSAASGRAAGQAA